MAPAKAKAWGTLVRMSSFRRLMVLLVGAGVASLGWAQSAPVASAPVASSQAGAPSSGPSTAGSGGAAVPGASGAVTTLKAAVQLVVVDVVVTDRNHKPVHGLTAANFALTEGNVPQTLRHFEEHTAPTLADATKFGPMPKLPPGMFTNYTPAPANGAVSVVLLDWLNTPLEDQAYARQQFLAYLKSVPPGTRIAVFGLGLRLYLLQGFTSDTSVLKAAFDVERQKGTPLVDDVVGGGGTQNNETDDLEDQGTTPDFVISNLRQFDAMGQTFNIMTRTKYTLDAMDQIARYLSGIPGRKNLIWFSGAFPLDILPDDSGASPNGAGGAPGNPFASMGSSEDEFRDTVTRLAHSEVSVYPIDVRGIQAPPMFNAASTRNYGGANGGRRMNQDNRSFLQNLAAEHATMDDIAYETGGRAFYNTNDLTHAVTSAVEDGSNFYTLSYTPAKALNDGKLRKIKVSLAPGGYELSYRKGYYADAPDKGDKAVVKANAADTAPAPDSRQQSLRLAMMRGAPTPSDILIKVAVGRMTVGNKTEDELAASNRPAPTTKGPYKRYAVDYAISPHDLTWIRGDDGKVHIDYDVLIYVYNANGDLQNWLGGSHHVVGSGEQVQATAMHGIFLHEEVSVPAKGQYFLRIGVRDQHRDHFGVIEVATSQVRDVVAEAGLAGAPAAAANGVPAASAK